MSTTRSSCHDRPGPAAQGPGAPAGAPHGDDLEQQAATWAVRRRSGLDADGQARLQAWLAADPRHAAALQALSATLDGVQQLPASERARLRAGLPDQYRQRRQPARPSLWPQRLRSWVPQAAAAAAAVVALAAVGTGGFLWWQQPVFEQAYATQRGQQILATLPDDAHTATTVQLDAGTRLNAQLFRDRREVALSEGQAMFTVHADAGRPFHVLAGGWRITVVGTRFSVRHTATGLAAGHTVVAVEEGRVRVQPLPRKEGAPPSTQAPAVVELGAGQMLSGDDGGDSHGDGDATHGLGRLSAIAPAAVAPWRSGRISFNQTPLAQALAEFERYGPTGLVVRDPAVAALPVGGSYGLQQSRRFAEFLPHLLPVRLVQRDGVTEIVAR